MKSKNLHVGDSGSKGVLGALGAWWPALLVAVGIFLLSSTPASSLPSRWPPGTDKLAHAGVYALLGAFITRACWHRAAAHVGRWRIGILAVLLAIGYGLSDEVHQLFVPGRHFELADLLADGCGALLGTSLMLRFQRSKTIGRPREALPSQPTP